MSEVIIDYSEHAEGSTLMCCSHTGNLKSLNDLATQARADFIIHTGDFGFYDEDSLKRIADKYASCVMATECHV